MRIDGNENLKFCLFNQDGCIVVPSDAVYQTEGEGIFDEAKIR